MDLIIFAHCSMWAASFVYLFVFYVRDVTKRGFEMDGVPSRAIPFATTVLFIITMVMSAVLGFFWFIFNPIVHPWIIKQIDELGY